MHQFFNASLWTLSCFVKRPLTSIMNIGRVTHTGLSSRKYQDSIDSTVAANLVADNSIIIGDYLVAADSVDADIDCRYAADVRRSGRKNGVENCVDSPIHCRC